jgi:hypothetical protein
MHRLAHQFACILFLAFSIAGRVNAGDDFALPGDDVQLPDLYQLKLTNWQHLSNESSGQEYEPAEIYSRQLLHGAVVNYLESKLTSLGIPHTATTLTGAALIFAIGQDAKLDLNESKTMSLQFQDLKDADRAVLYRLKYSW